jgi:hypothetical protein
LLKTRNWEKSCIFAKILFILNIKDIAMATLRRNTSYENIFVRMPQSDTVFFQLFAEKMGLLIENKEDLLRKYIASRPKNVDLTDEDILEEVKSIRYNK